MDKIKVWDGFTRFFHWALVLLLAGLYYTADNAMMAWHFLLGYCTLALLATRLIWGVIGSQSARFSAMLFKPTTILKSIKTPVVSVGHSPTGSLMVWLFFILLSFQLLSGLMSTDGILTEGPLVSLVGYQLAEQMTDWHKLSFDVITIAIVLHILAVVIYQLKGQQLLQGMLHGKKPAAIKGVLKPSVWAFAILLVLLSILYFTWAQLPLSEL